MSLSDVTSLSQGIALTPMKKRIAIKKAEIIVSASTHLCRRKAYTVTVIKLFFSITSSIKSYHFCDNITSPHNKSHYKVKSGVTVALTALKSGV